MFPFFIDSVNAVAGTNWPLLHVLLPIGVSFHTFQSMGYTVDVYRRDIKPIRNPLDYQLFVTFFPQLVAGPIERATQLLPQVLRERTVTWKDIDAGTKLMVLGYFKKVVIADNLGPVVDLGFSSEGHTLTGAAVVLATYAFALQIYCDFSGYSDIARGISRLLGFNLMENFRQPYFAVNPSDFWRRWHISLSTWLRDYVYIPLGGNRHGTARTYMALALTMLIGGIWHGAAWTFVIWGAYHGALLITHRAIVGRRKAETRWTLKRVLMAVAFLQLTCLGWLIFRARSWDNLTDLLAALASPTNWTSAAPVNVGLVVAGLLMVFAIDLWNEAKPKLSMPMFLKMASYACIIVATVVWSPETISSFIYFQF
jgi:alginate O-acetyltransferase complex protein AlgI